MKATKRKELSERAQKVIIMVLAIGIFVLISIAGYCIGLFITPKSMGNDEFADCEKVAQQIYDQLGDEMIEVPQGYSMKKTETQITVKKDGYSGFVEATLLNGELSFKHNDGTEDKVLMGIGGVCISWLALLLILLILNKKFDFLD